jgi:hypothetical protein
MIISTWLVVIEVSVGWGSISKIWVWLSAPVPRDVEVLPVKFSELVGETDCRFFEALRSFSWWYSWCGIKNSICLFSGKVTLKDMTLQSRQM